MEDLLGSGQAFERWIKMGSVTPGSAAEAVDLPDSRKPHMLLRLQMTACHTRTSMAFVCLLCHCLVQGVKQCAELNYR